MLANLLPGIRQLRTPLAVGYVWLLTFWLWIPEQFKSAAPSGVSADIMQITHYAGRIVVGVAISFVAYLVGALSEPLNGPFVRLGAWIATSGANMTGPTFTRCAKDYLDRISHIWHRLSWRTRLPTYPDNDRPDNYRVIDVTKTGQFTAVGANGLAQFVNQSFSRGIVRKDAGIEYAQYVMRELPRQGNALLGKEPELFSAYDRLISEYEFRVGITVPLGAFIITLAVRWSVLWLLMLLPLPILLATGVWRRMRAGDLLVVALRRGGLDIVPPSYLTPSTDSEHEKNA